MKQPLRFVLATPVCDGHDVAVCAITRILRHEGVEAVYIGFNKTPQQIVKAAVEESADAIALSSYNGGHMQFFRDVLKEQKKLGIPDVPLFCGGGGTILENEVAPLEKNGVTKVYRPPLDLAEACRDMIDRAAKSARGSRKAPAGGTNGSHAGNGAAGNGAAAGNGSASFRELAGRIRRAEASAAARKVPALKNGRRWKIPTWGVGGRGGAGKSTIVDELIFRFLQTTKGRLAVISVDPTLGDRLRMLYCYSPRVFLRSVALGPGDSVRDRVVPALEVLQKGPFDLIIVESVGLGQNDIGVADLVDASVYCMTPEYGTNVQLEKEALLNQADIVVMNKRDYPQAEARARRVRGYLRPEQGFVLTEAKNHGDPGVTELFDMIYARTGLRHKPLETGNARASMGEDSMMRSGYLGRLVEEHENYYKEMEAEIAAAQKDPKLAARHRREFKSLWDVYGFDGDRTGTREKDGTLLRDDPDGRPVPVARFTTCGIWVPVLGLPPRDSDLAAIIRYLHKQNLPGRFPFTEGAFTHRRADQDPIRMFAGLGLPETTNERFHLLMKRGGAPRLSTAFDSITLYGMDSDDPGALAKVGEGGVAVDSVEDMMRLYDGFNLEEGSVSLTMNGPAPAIMALYLAAARRCGFDWKKMRGTIQTDILKEIQAQNEAVFPLEPSLRLIMDMFDYLNVEAPLWYPISVSGYHIHEAGANPIMELAFTLANGFTYVEMLRRRGLPVEAFTKRFSFFFTSGSEVEFNVLGRVARRIWSVGMKRYFGIEGAGQRLKFHTQTSGRSLQDVEPLHNLARVTLQATRALANNTNSLHTNSYKETYSTPEEDDVILAMGCQQIPLLESGDYRFTENLTQGAWGLDYLEDAVERAVHAIFREIDQQGGVIPAIENEYFRSLIQEEVQREQRARRENKRLIVGLNYMNYGSENRPRGALVNIPLTEKRRQASRTKAFKKKNRRRADAALARLQETARGQGNVFAELVQCADVATVGQVTRALQEVWGRFRPSM